MSLTELALDAGQQHLVDHREGALIALGGPGTGKTTALERRYLSLTEEKVAAHRVLTLVPNRSYAVPARDRLATHLPFEAMVEVPIYTWHSLAYHLISRYYPRLGYSEAPVLLTAPEQWGTVRELLASETPTGWPVWGDRLKVRGFVDEVADFCLRVTQSMMSEDELEALAGRGEGWDEIVGFYRRYREVLKDRSRVDHSVMLAEARRLLVDEAEVGESLVRRFPHLQVDDAQEMSRAGRELLQAITPESLVLAGDPDSSVEGFRGAEPEWLFGPQGFPEEPKRVHLEQTYRLGADALSRTGQMISSNDPSAEHRPAVPAAHASLVEARLYPSGAEEADDIARDLRRLHVDDAVAYSQMAVLVSQPGQLLASLERALARWQVPFVPLWGDRPLAEQPIIAAFLDLVRVALEIGDWRGRVADLVTTPLVGMDLPTRRGLEREAWQTDRDPVDLLMGAPEASELHELVAAVRAHHERADGCFWEVYQAGRYFRDVELQARRDRTGPRADELDALVAFSHALGRFVERRHGQGSITDYLEEATRADFGGDPWLAPRRREGTDAVTVLSFHAARGRQWDVVYVMGCLDAWIPKGTRGRGLFDPLALEIGGAPEREVESIAEDRRTFYVAATRAARRVVFSLSPGPGGRGRPTRFVAEMGLEPAPHDPGESAPLTLRELRARLRRTLKDAGSSGADKAAALVALAKVPGADPMRWYGRWGWTEGAPAIAADELRTSYSRLGAYENCGLQYLLQSVLGLDPSSSEAMKFGTLMHNLFEAVHNKKITTPKDLRREFHDRFDPKWFPNRTMARQYERDGERMLEAFWKHLFRDEDVVTEHQFEFDYEGATLRGRIDRIDVNPNGLALWDYKTAKWAISGREASESLQLAIYYLAAKSDPELKELGEPLRAKLAYPGSVDTKGVPRKAVQQPEDSEKVIENLGPMIAAIKQEDFSPNPKADCFFCRMKPLCPMWPEGREVPA